MRGQAGCANHKPRRKLASMLSKYKPYDAVRASDDPDKLLLGFWQETYVGAAELAKWDRKSLEREFPATD